jgi:hypothetical protein
MALLVRRLSSSEAGLLLLLHGMLSMGGQLADLEKAHTGLGRAHHVAGSAMRCSPCCTDGGLRLCCSPNLRMGGFDGGQETVAFNER